MAPPIIFSFGAGETWLMGTEAKRVWHDCPIDVATVLKDSTNIALACAFGPGNPYQYFFSWRNKDGRMHQICSDLPDTLDKWLFNGKCARRDLKTLSITLGPNNSFFAMDKDGYRWGDLPRALETALQNCLSPTGWSIGAPMSVALGIEQTWAILHADGSISYSLGDKYDKLKEYLRQPQTPNNSAKMISLDAFEAGNFFVVTHQGTTVLSVPDPLNKRVNAVFGSLAVTIPTPPQTVASLGRQLTAAREKIVSLQNQLNTVLANARKTIQEQSNALAAGNNALNKTQEELRRARNYSSLSTFNNYSTFNDDYSNNNYYDTSNNYRYEDHTTHIGYDSGKHCAQW